jgi:hypothetical protein
MNVFCLLRFSLAVSVPQIQKFAKVLPKKTSVLVLQMTDRIVCVYIYLHAPI